MLTHGVRNTIILLLACVPLRVAATPIVESATISLYSEHAAARGFAWIEERREIELRVGLNRVQWSPVPRSVLPHSLVLEPLTAEAKAAWKHTVTTLPATEGDLLAQSVGSLVTVEPKGRPGRTYTGTLVRTGPPLVTRDALGKLHVFMEPARVELQFSGDHGSDVPGVTIDVDTLREGKWPVALRYETPALQWQAEHWATLFPDASENQGQLELSTTLLVHNDTEVTWKSASLRFIAGTLRRADRQLQWGARGAHQEVAAALAADTVPRPERVGEYYEFAATRPVTVPAQSQVVVAGPGPFHNVPYEQEFICRSSILKPPVGKSGPILERAPAGGQRVPVEVFLRLHTGKSTGIDVPLASGILRVGQKRVPEGTWQLVGEAEIPHTPVGDTLEVPLGVAFDAVAERKVTDFTVLTDHRQLEEAVEVVIRNYKAKPVEVRVFETLYRASEWEIVTSRPEYEKIDANTIAFRITAPAGGQGKATYRVRYRW